MKHSATVGLVGWLLAGLSAVAIVRENPYEKIAARNPFGLRPQVILPPVKELAVPPPPLSEVRISGVTTLLGAAKATFQCEDKQTKKVEYSPLLGEGESYKTFSVVLIDAENSRVRINQAGTETTLDFVNNGVKPSPTPPQPASPIRVAPFPGAPINAARPGERVIISGGPGTVAGTPPFLRAPTSPAEEAIEVERARLQAQESNGERKRGQPASVILPPSRAGAIQPNLPSFR